MGNKTAIINIDEKYRVKLVRDSYLLEYFVSGGDLNKREGIAKITKDRWVKKGYHPTLQSALRKIIDMESTENGQEYKDLHSYMEVLNQLDLKYGNF